MGTLREFTQVADAIRAVSGKLEKTRLLSDLLAALPDDDLYWAAIYFTGSAFARNSGRVVQTGFASVQSALMSLAGVTPERFGEEFLKWSDLGDTAGVLFQGRQGNRDLSLSDLAERLTRLADTPAGTAKTAATVELFRELGPDEARYVAKILMAELRIGLQEGLVEDAIARAFAVKPAEVRKAHQLIVDIGALAQAARHGRLDALAVALFRPVKPMLASPETDPAVVVQRVGPELWIEDKFDGIRAQAHRDGDRVALFSRDLKEVTEQFPEVVEALRRLPDDLILDGELLAHQGGTALPFFELQKRLGRKNLTEKILSAVPVGYFAFDLLYQAGEALLDHPLRERRARLEALPQVPGFYLSPLRVRPVEALETEFAIAKARANEGLMIKHPDSVYVPGRRGMSWLKFKKPLDPLDVVVTGVEFGHGKRRDVFSDYTFAVRDDASGELVNIGKAYTGLTDAEIAEYTEYFKQNILRSYGRFHLVRPEVVIEVAFEAIQESPRHKSGFALRFPRIMRIRTDKTPADINTLEDVRRMYAGYRSVYETVEGTEPQPLRAFTGSKSP